MNTQSNSNQGTHNTRPSKIKINTNTAAEFLAVALRSAVENAKATFGTHGAGTSLTANNLLRPFIFAYSVQQRISSILIEGTSS